MRSVLKFAVAALVLLLPLSATAQQQPELIVGASVNGYHGWNAFCEDYPVECNLPKIEAQKIHLTPEVMRVLGEVNVQVNSTVQFKLDIEHWGTGNPRYTLEVLGSPGVDKWDFAEDGYGDCEDYAILKKKLLIEKGFPRSALLLTIVSVPNRKSDVKTSSKNESHMVLMVRTDQGDLILDYIDVTNEVLRWNKTDGYVYASRQSEEDPNVWVSLTSPITAEAK